VQSTALLVLAAQGRINFRTFLMANVGDDSEHPATLDYVRTIAMPYAAAHGLELHELDKVLRDGTTETLYGRLTRPGSRSLPIPIRMADTGAPGTRSCTMDFKIRVIGRWLRQHGASEANPATVAVGFSTDEMHRASRKKAQPWEVPEYPLLDLGLSRSACQALIAEAGLPVPPKSACWFCPFHRPATWAEMRRDDPDLFDRAVALEGLLNGRRDGLPCPGGGEWPAERWVSYVVCHAHGPDCDGWNEDGYYGQEGDACQIEHVERLVEGPGLTRGAPGGPGRCHTCNQRVTLDGDGRVPDHGKDHVYLTRFGKPLDQAITEAQPSLFAQDGPENCDEGYCWT
jgi:hypothetical protein